MSKQLNIVLPEQMEERLEEKSEETGLSKSEIGRRGIHNELQKLEGGQA
jgi:predicted DNA-binding protein